MDKVLSAALWKTGERLYSDRRCAVEKRLRAGLKHHVLGSNSIGPLYLVVKRPVDSANPVPWPVVFAVL
jgi:hypothetical protein